MSCCSRSTRFFHFHPVGCCDHKGCGPGTSPASRLVAVRLAALLGVAFMALAVIRLAAAADTAESQPIRPKAMDRIPPGTVVFDASQRRFSNLILFMRGKPEAGDVDVVNDVTRYYTELFNLVYMANCKQVGNRFQLDQVAVGYSTKVNGKDVVVSSETARGLGMSLSFIGRSVLSGNEKALEDIRVVARNDQCAVIDAPAVVRYNERNEPMVVRFLIWTSADTGQIGTTAWLLAKVGTGYALAEESFHYLPPDLVHDGVLHVDRSQFTVGIPSATAFAMTAIPSGRAYTFTERLKRVAAVDSFNKRTFEELIVSVAQAMGQVN